MKITSKGQVTIPQELRNQLGLLPGTEVRFVAEGNSLRVERETGTESRGRRLVDHLRGKATVAMSTDEILALTRTE